MKQRTFFIIFKGLLMKKITQKFLGGKSPILIKESCNKKVFYFFLIFALIFDF